MLEFSLVGWLCLAKMPFSSRLGLISFSSLITNVALLPAIIAGTGLGILLVHRISQQAFNRLVQILACLAAILLLFR
ncbi:hypothetical protein ACFL3F_02920 [Planctomycetota bacterium]